MNVFQRPGLYLRNPRGGVEDVAAMALDGFSAIACNVADHEPAEWQTVIERARLAGVVCLPWARCRTNQEVIRLCTLAREWPDKPRKVIVNAERELLDGTVRLAGIVTLTEGLETAISTEPWVGELDLTGLPPRVTLHLQLFPQENGTSSRARDCRAHAFERGAPRVEFMLGVHTLPTVSFPSRQGGYWVYTADDCAGDFERWGPQIIPPLHFPFTGPLYGPNDPRMTTTPRRTKTARALKMALHRAGFGTFLTPSGLFDVKLEAALWRLQRWAGLKPTGNYGRPTYEVFRRLGSAIPGELYALRPAALDFIYSDAMAAVA